MNKSCDADVIHSLEGLSGGAAEMPGIENLAYRC
jgi:hypothetical protein